MLETRQQAWGEDPAVRDGGLPPTALRVPPSQESPRPGQMTRPPPTSRLQPPDAQSTETVRNDKRLLFQDAKCGVIH